MAANDILSVPDGKGNFISYYDEPHLYQVDGKPEIKFNSSSSMAGPFFAEFPEDAAKNYGKRHQMTEQQVKDLWQSRADYGTRVHEFCEYFSLNKYPLPEPTNEEDENAFEIMRSSLTDLFENYECVNCEQLAVNVEWRLAGLVDAIYRHKKTGKIIIVDFKTNFKISKESYPPGKTGFDKLAHLPDTSYIKYSLQLSLYKKLLIEQFPNIPEYKDASLYIFHIQKSKCVSIPCNYYEKECEILIDAGLNRLGLPNYDWNKKPKKIYLISHVDADGAGPHILLNSVFGKENVDAVHCGYKTVDSKVHTKIKEHLKSPDNSEVWITDICPYYSEEMMKLLSSVKHLTLLDHHKTSLDSWTKENIDKLSSKSHTCTIDATGNHCGTSLTYLELRRRGFDIKEYSKLVSNISYLDRWLFNKCDCEKDYTNIFYCDTCTSARNIDKIFRKYGMNRFVNRFTYNPSIEFSIEEAALIAEYNISLRDQIEKLEPMHLDDCDEVVFVQCTGYINEVAEYMMYEQNSKIVIMQNTTYGGVSIRGRQDCGLHVGETLRSINEDFGGHDLAGGLSVQPIEVIQEVMEVFVKKIK